MTLDLEVIRKNQHMSNADALLYTPMNAELGSKHSRVYRFDFDGDLNEMSKFAREVLLDEVSQEMIEGSNSVISDSLFYIDYGMKAGALDLEKEALMNYYKSRSNNQFSLNQLTISQRVYIFGKGDPQLLSQKFVKDIVNPAVHKHSVTIR
jgi:hypothetical protein